MADQDRTEQPTEKRKREAREKGQVARSQDLSGAAVVAVGVVAALLMGSKVVNLAGGTMRSILGRASHPNAAVSAAGLHGLMLLSFSTIAKTAGPVIAACLVTGVVANVGQVGLRLGSKAAQPSFSKINPLTGVKNLFNVNKVFELGKDIVKVSVVGGLVALALVPDLTKLGASVGTPPAALGTLIGRGVKAIALRAALAYLLVGAADYAWQRHRTSKSLKMTKQEVKDELRQRDIAPEIKRAIRRQQIRRSRARMMAAVPTADVVVTNPTHFAVALRYSNELPAPTVVAKGADNVAYQIRRIATEAEVPIVENPPLARELYRTVEIDQMIPASLYSAVAKVLAFVYKLAARRRVAV